MSLPGTLGTRLREKLKDPRNQVSLFTWAYRLGLALMLLGYAIIGYFLWKGGFTA